MREHEFENSRPAPRTTPSIVIWVLFAVAAGGICVLATVRSEVVIASAEHAMVSKSVSAPISTGAPTSRQSPVREPTAMGD